MTKLRKAYHNVFEFLFGGPKFLLIGVAVGFLAVGVLGALYCMNDQKAMWELMETIQESLGDISKEGFAEAVDLFINNATVCLLSLGLGLIPFLFPTAFVLVSNGFIMGVLWAMYASQGLNPIPYYIAGILPHGIFELPAIFISVTLGLYLSYTISKRIVQSKHAKGTVVPVLKNSALTFVLVIIPLLVVAALVESFITPITLGWVG